MSLDWDRMYIENVENTPLFVFGFNPILLPDDPTDEYIISMNLRSEVNDNVITSEIWKLVPYNDVKDVTVSNYGRIRNHRGNFIKATNKNGRLYVRLPLKYDKCFRDIALDKIILYTFTGNEVRRIIHIDGNLYNNRLDNLTFKS